MAGNAGGVEARLARLGGRLHAFRAEVLKWQLEHARHHAVGESRWGLVALMAAHPFRTLAVGAAVGAFLAGGPGGECIRHLLERWLR
jgi:hypothetical protein